jgi:hypothetical protein
MTWKPVQVVVIGCSHPQGIEKRNSGPKRKGISLTFGLPIRRRSDAVSAGDSLLLGRGKPWK